MLPLWSGGKGKVTAKRHSLHTIHVQCKYTPLIIDQFTACPVCKLDAQIITVICQECVHVCTWHVQIFIYFILPQFFDRDGDGIVSEADLSSHLPFRSLSHLHENNGHQKQDFDAPPNEMNMGE